MTHSFVSEFIMNTLQPYDKKCTLLQNYLFLIYNESNLLCVKTHVSMYFIVVFVCAHPDFMKRVLFKILYKTNKCVNVTSYATHSSMCIKPFINFVSKTRLE